MSTASLHDSMDERTPILPQTTIPTARSCFVKKYPTLHFASLAVLFTALLSASTYVSYLQLKDGYSLFALHPIFMIHAFVFATLAITLHQSRRHLLSQPIVKSFAVPANVHTPLAAIAVLSATAGMAIMVYIKTSESESHFDSPHSIAGLATVLAVLAQGLVGATGKYSPGVYGGLIRARKVLRIVHRKTGYVVLGGFATALWFGIEYLGLPEDSAAAKTLKVVVVGSVVGTVVRVIYV